MMMMTLHPDPRPSSNNTQIGTRSNSVWSKSPSKNQKKKEQIKVNESKCEMIFSKLCAPIVQPNLKLSFGRREGPHTQVQIRVKFLHGGLDRCTLAKYKRRLNSYWSPKFNNANIQTTVMESVSERIQKCRGWRTLLRPPATLDWASAAPIPCFEREYCNSWVPNESPWIPKCIWMSKDVPSRIISTFK